MLIDVYIDEGTAGQPVYADIGEGGRVEISGESDDEQMVDDSLGGFFEHSDSVYCISSYSHSTPYSFPLSLLIFTFFPSPCI